VDEDGLRVNGTCVIPLDELEWRFDTSGGPGGQHANRSRTRVEVSFDVAASPSLSERHRERLRSKLGDVVRVAAGDARSQVRNREVALDRLRSRLALALREERPRRATSPSRGSKERRLASKRRRSDIKRQRRIRPGDE
jgi:ribosome-associated protein